MNLRASLPIRRLLFKLGIKSAEVTTFEETIIAMTDNFGHPDKLFMSEDAFSTFMEEFYDKNNK